MKKIWMLTFESADVATFGGLGPAVANLARSLANNFEVSVFMPSHGRQNDPRIRDNLQLQAVREVLIEGARKGVDGNFYSYKIGFERGLFRGVNYFLAKGLDSDSGKWLDDPQIYDGELTFQKMSLLARGMEGFLNWIISKHPDDAPQLIHAHDWHTVPASVALKQIAVQNELNVPLVYTIHLLGGRGLPWHYMSDDWSGIRNLQHRIYFDGKISTATYREVWDNISSGLFERFGANESDFVTSVSNTYLQSDIIPFLGGGVFGKNGYIYNACDWDEKAIVQRVITDHPQIASVSDRASFRKYLLTKALGEMGAPVIPEPDVRQAVGNSLGSTDKIPMPFAEDGPLVIMTGRLDYQKGVDTLLRAVPLVLEIVPSAKFLLLLIPILQREVIDSTLRDSARYKDNVRMILGRAPKIYGLAHMAADVYAMPSRWEPFGLTALEAMATGNPVAGTQVGGINETVVDISTSGSKGTGHLVPKEDFRELARTISSFLLMMKIDGDKNLLAYSSLAGRIPNEQIRSLVERDRSVGSMIRENCKARVKTHFSEAKVAEMAVQVYERASAISTERLS